MRLPFSCSIGKLLLAHFLIIPPNLHSRVFLYLRNNCFQWQYSLVACSLTLSNTLVLYKAGAELNSGDGFIAFSMRSWGGVSFCYQGLNYIMCATFHGLSRAGLPSFKLQGVTSLFWEVLSWSLTRLSSVLPATVSFHSAEQRRREENWTQVSPSWECFGCWVVRLRGGAGSLPAILLLSIICFV